MTDVEWSVSGEVPQNDGRGVLQRAGMRVTAVRLAVLEALGRSRAPVTAQDLVDLLADQRADRVTVYRTLNSLVEAGVAHKVDPGDRVYRFGLSSAAAPTAPGSSGHQHPHFVCDACGNVECLEDTEVIVQRRPGKKTAGSKGGDAAGAASVKKRTMRLSAQDVLLHGTCEGCGEEEAASPRRRARS